MEEPLKIEEFVSGRRERGAGYSFFVPEKVNRQWSWSDAGLNTLLEKASIQVGQLNSYARLVPNIDLFIQLHVTKEAVVSSRIEGTRTNVEEALMQEEDIDPERRDDWYEVRNYSNAMNAALAALEKLPVSTRLLRQAHKILLQGVRGQHRLPGELRSSQNWIGGASLTDAAFIPPSHAYVHELMGDLENFLHNEDIEVPALIRIGIAHYQFETIHPFLDGNGRIGRLLITLYLISTDYLNKPLLYLSSFFEENKILYYDNLTKVRDQNDLIHWLKYFLVGVEKTSRQACDTLVKILQLKEELETRIRQQLGRKTPAAQALLKALFNHPIVHIKDVRGICSLSAKAAGDLVSDFEKMGILKEMTGFARNRVFAFESYLSLFGE
ncbi:Fic family protein [Siphonobacter aquaeclarae]|uniref:Fic family protein n=1 Tax=Siphonobacter aquaeclarae TaxID=563176 RepID=A0A1G9M6G2_9BACT|nr:Fic family protein [Siphonobacter aquaeclarae]SDL69733.1 Fic family protein [Siphonobacter aquaeclarae]